MKTFVTTIFLALATTVLAGTPQKVDLKVESLELKNGKNLGAATIKSLDHETGTVIVMSDRSLASVQLELLPDQVAERVVALVPPESKAIARDRELDRDRGRREAKADAEARSRRIEAQLKADRETRSGNAQIQIEAQRKAQETARVKAAARRAMERHFRYDFVIGPSTWVFRTEIELEEPEPMAGWPGRHRIRGTAGIQYYVSRGESLNSMRRDFEVTMRENERGALEASDITIK